ncbi:DMT family transporter [Litchfieldia salsa]|uniref:EamA domain-containing membrane protein RarD n=1 Tax=Litchfieldia salsa TaxID=930152 RepID=A0A1H0RRE5_9BACI|nr:DMT family transporter [Litchfieldia salsa]SDP31975.1 EamA domain-containing membrane protein RarD [Litchfieldia salsa]
MSKIYIYSSLLFVTLLWGLNVIATKILVTTFAPVTMTSFRIFTAGIVAFLILFSFKKVKVVSFTQLRYIFIASLFNVVGHHFFLSIGLTKTSASNAGLILGLSPLISVVLATLILKNKLTITKAIGISTGFTGVCFVILNGASNISGISIGDLFIFLSIATQGFSFVMIKKVTSTLDPTIMTAYMLIFGSIILFILSTIVEPDGLSSMRNGSLEVWLIFFASAIFATGISHMIYNRAIQEIGVAESAIFINLIPFFSLIGAVTFLNEKISILQVSGFLFIVIGVLLGSGTLDRRLAIFRNRTLRKETI